MKSECFYMWDARDYETSEMNHNYMHQKASLHPNKLMPSFCGIGRQSHQISSLQKVKLLTLTCTPSRRL